MRVTARDRRLLEDVALHQVMTREQVVALGYFTSVTRANARLLELRRAKLLRTICLNPALHTRQHLYTVAAGATPFLDERIVALLRARSATPRHLDHALAVVSVRISLLRLGLDRWLGEPQVRHRYVVREGTNRRSEDFRPDAVAVLGGQPVFVEVDRGNASTGRVKQKFATYRAYVRSGLFASQYGNDQARLLFVTTGELRKRHVESVLKAANPVAVAVETYTSLASKASFAEVSFR